MTARLLTDDGIGKAIPMAAFEPGFDRTCPYRIRALPMDFVRVTHAQDARSVKLDRQAMAEWLGNLDREGMGEWVYIKDSDEELLREGKAPWEEDYAVHTARKTPRTISPD